MRSLFGSWPKSSSEASATTDLTVADRAALALRLDGARAGQDRADDRVADHGPFLREGEEKGNKDVRGSCRLKHLVPLALCRSYLAAAGETPVVVGRPAGAVSVMLVLEEAGVGVLLQLLGVPRHQLLHFRLLHVNPGPRLAVVGHVDLEAGEGEVEREGEAGKDRKKKKIILLMRFGIAFTRTGVSKTHLRVNESKISSWWKRFRGRVFEKRAASKKNPSPCKRPLRR